MSYATLAQLKAAITVEESDTDTDANLQRALDAATEWIDNYTGRVFGAVTASSQRVFDPTSSTRLSIPDAAAVTVVAIDEDDDGTFSDTIASTEYQLYPLNVGQPGVRGNYREIRIRPTSSEAFPVGRQVRITGTWGYGSTPASVEQACILLAQRYFRRKDAPFGVIQAPETGEIARVPQNDPDVRQLLEEFRSTLRDWVLV